MFMSSLQNALIFTIHTIFSVYIMIVLFCFLLQLVRGDTYNPLAQFAFKVTNPVLKILRKICPKIKNFDLAALILALVLQTLEVYLILLVKGFGIAWQPVAIAGLFVWGLGELIDLFLVFLFFIILLQVLASFMQSRQHNSSFRVLDSITRPLYRPIHKILPTFGGLDFSPLILIFVIFLCRMLFVDPIIFYGRGLI